MFRTFTNESEGSEHHQMKEIRKIYRKTLAKAGVEASVTQMFLLLKILKSDLQTVISHVFHWFPNTV